MREKVTFWKWNVNEHHKKLTTILFLEMLQIVIKEKHLLYLQVWSSSRRQPKKISTSRLCLNDWWTSSATKCLSRSTLTPRLSTTPQSQHGWRRTLTLATRTVAADILPSKGNCHFMDICTLTGTQWGGCTWDSVDSFIAWGGSETVLYTVCSYTEKLSVAYVSFSFFSVGGSHYQRIGDFKRNILVIPWNLFHF